MIDRVAAQNWQEIGKALDSEGWAVLPGLLADAECDGTAALYDDAPFRSRIVMTRYGFGRVSTAISAIRCRT